MPLSIGIGNVHDRQPRAEPLRVQANGQREQQCGERNDFVALRGTVEPCVLLKPNWLAPPLSPVWSEKIIDDRTPNFPAVLKPERQIVECLLQLRFARLNAAPFSQSWRTSSTTQRATIATSSRLGGPQHAERNRGESLGWTYWLLCQTKPVSGSTQNSFSKDQSITLISQSLHHMTGGQRSAQNFDRFLTRIARAAVCAGADQAKIPVVRHQRIVGSERRRAARSASGPPSRRRNSRRLRL